MYLFLGEVWIFVTIHYKTAPLSSDVFSQHHDLDEL